MTTVNHYKNLYKDEKFPVVFQRENHSSPVETGKNKRKNGKPRSRDHSSRLPFTRSLISLLFLSATAQMQGR